MSEFADAVFHLPPETDAPTRLAALEEKIAACAHGLDTGDVQSMEGMDKEVERLCQQVMAMPADEAMPYIHQLQILSDAFTALGEAMQNQKNLLRDELGNLQSRHKAHRAYGMMGPSTTRDTPEQNEE